MAEMAAPKLAEEELLRMTADVVAAYVSDNSLPTTQLAEVINAVYNSLRSLEGQAAEPQPNRSNPQCRSANRSRPITSFALKTGRS